MRVETLGGSGRVIEALFFPTSSVRHSFWVGGFKPLGYVLVSGAWGLGLRRLEDMPAMAEAREIPRTRRH